MRHVLTQGQQANKEQRTDSVAWHPDSEACAYNPYHAEGHSDILVHQKQALGSLQHDRRFLAKGPSDFDETLGPLPPPRSNAQLKVFVCACTFQAGRGMSKFSLGYPRGLGPKRRLRTVGQQGLPS